MFSFCSLNFACNSFFSSLNFLRVTVSYKCSNREVAFIVSLSIGKGAGITFDMMSLNPSVSSQIFVFLQLCHWRSYCSNLGEFVGDKFLPALFKIIRCEPFFLCLICVLFPLCQHFVNYPIFWLFGQRWKFR